MSRRGSAKGRVTLESRENEGLQHRFAAGKAAAKKLEMEGEVVVGFRLYALRDVSHKNHTFHASFRCFYDWIDVELAQRLVRSDGGDEASAADWWSAAIPELSFTNASTFQAEPWPHPPRVIDAVTGRVYAHRRYEGVFNERLEMQEFPFDTQRLSITMQLSKSEFRAHSIRLLPIELRGVPSVPGWSLLAPVTVMTPEEEKARNKSKAEIGVHFRVRREAGFYVRCILSLQMLLTSLSFISFMLSVDGVWDRVEIELALIFALMALRFASAETVPIVPYLTTLDAYQNSCIITLAALALVQAVVFGAARRGMEYGHPWGSPGLTYEQESLFTSLDVYIGSVSFGFWALFNVVFFWGVSRRIEHAQVLISSSTSRGSCSWTAPWSDEDHNVPWVKTRSRGITYCESSKAHESSGLLPVTHSARGLPPAARSATALLPDARVMEDRQTDTGAGGDELDGRGRMHSGVV